MVQKLLGAVGIVGVLIRAGLLILNSGANPDLGNTALKGGVTIGLIFGVLGVIGIIITLLKRLAF